MKYARDIITDMSNDDLLHGNTHSRSSSYTPSPDEAGLRSQHQQVRAHLENQLRVKKLEVTERQHRLLDILRDTTHLEGERHHIQEDIRRIEGEFHRLEADAIKVEKESKEAQVGLREKDSELRWRSDETNKLEREIDHLRQEITEKEKKIHELKEETRAVVRGKEELRRESEMEHFTANTEAGQAHEKSIQLQRFKQELMRKESEISHKNQEHEKVKHDLMFKEQDVATLEAEIRHIKS